MKLKKLFAATSVICASILPSLSHAQHYPSRAIQFIVPYTPGTTADSMARLLGTKISQRWGVPVIVDNKVGASGIIGTDAVAKAAPDGYTFLFTATNHGTLAAVNPKLPYEPIKSFAPVVLLGTNSMTLVVGSKYPVKTVRELVDQVKKQPDALNYASPGVGGAQHLAMELFKQETGISMLHVPYKGSAGALLDIVAGHVQAGVVSVQTATPYVKRGDMRMLAIMGRERVPTFPQVPTMAEAGFGNNMVVDTWYGVFAPAGTPAAVVNKLNAEINSLFGLPEMKEAMAKMGLNPGGGTPAKLDTLVRDEIKMWTAVATRGKIGAE
jgi:tripartite-type tricarboxylate transporter receptor subunit TctC